MAPDREQCTGKGPEGVSEASGRGCAGRNLRETLDPLSSLGFPGKVHVCGVCVHPRVCVRSYGHFPARGFTDVSMSHGSESPAGYDRWLEVRAVDGGGSAASWETEAPKKNATDAQGLSTDSLVQGPQLQSRQ